MQWAWTGTNFGRRWGTGRPEVLQSMGSKRVGHNWVTEQQQHCMFEYSFQIWILKVLIKGKNFETMSCYTVQFSCLVVSDCLQPYGLQHARPLCPPPSPTVCPSSCPLHWWCHPIISSFVGPFSSCLQSFPASESFQMSQFFTSGGQSIGASTSATVFPMNIRGRLPLGWIGWLSLQSKGLSNISNTNVQKHQFFSTQLSL